MEDKQRNALIAANIKKFIKENKITQKKLAEEIGISPSTMSDYMNLRSNPSHGVIQKIADYFGIMKSDIDTTYKESASDISSIYNQLDGRRKKRVYNFAQTQLQEQQENKIASIENNKPENEEIHTIAAHSSDPDYIHTDEEIAELEAYLDELDKEYDRKQAQRDKWSK